MGETGDDVDDTPLDYHRDPALEEIREAVAADIECPDQRY